MLEKNFNADSTYSDIELDPDRLCSNIEPVPSKKAILFFVIGCFTLLYVAGIFLKELDTSEAINVLAAKDLVNGKGFGTLVDNTGHLKSYPLYPLLLSFLGRVTPLSEAICRIPSVLSVLGMALMAGYFAARAAGHKAGLTAAAVVLTNLAFIGYGVVGDGQALFAFLLSAAWFVWYRMNRIQNRPWQQIWLASLSLVWLAAMAGGLKAFILFYIPLLFIRRPLKARLRMRQWDHILILTGIVVSFIFVWNLLFPDLNSFFLGQADQGQSESQYYLIRTLYIFPRDILLATFPWCLIVWPIFCGAFQGVERTPILAKYLRTILVAPALIWMFTNAQFLSLLPLIPIVAVGGAMHYKIFIRRYYIQLESLMKVFFLVLSILSIGIIVVSILAYANIAPMKQVPNWLRIVNLAVATFALVSVNLIFFKGKHWLTFSCRLAILMVLATFTCRTAVNTWELTFDSDYSKLGHALTVNVPKKHLVYKLDHEPLYKLCHYLKRPVEAIKAAEELPDVNNLVYVLTTGKAPILETREWSLQTESTIYVDHITHQGPGSHLKKFQIWKGKLRPPLVEEKTEDKS